MRFGVIGTGAVGQTLARKLASLGHEVMMGARSADNEAAAAFAAEAGDGAGHGTFADAAAFADVVVNATGGAVSLEALRAAGADQLAGKVLIDVSNPLDFSQGFPPSLTVANTDSVGEQIQREFPDAMVVKGFNTVTAEVMVDPGKVPGDHNLFICGSDDAKALFVSIAGEFGWPADRVIDMGDIGAARGTEMFLAFWVRLYAAVGTRYFNIAVLTG